ALSLDGGGAGGGACVPQRNIVATGLVVALCRCLWSGVADEGAGRPGAGVGAGAGLRLAATGHLPAILASLGRLPRRGSRGGRPGVSAGGGAQPRRCRGFLLAAQHSPLCGSAGSRQAILVLSARLARWDAAVVAPPAVARPTVPAARSRGGGAYPAWVLSAG